jgi:multidrug efflux pump subunit AcrA (membrane-fusion protein)
MTTTVQIALERHEHVLALPLRAVRRDNGRTFVYVRRGNGIERQWVTTGSQDDSFLEIAEGLREGDEVLVGDVSTLMQTGNASRGSMHDVF